jgi:hypothetical protein
MKHNIIAGWIPEPDTDQEMEDRIPCDDEQPEEIEEEQDDFDTKKRDMQSRHPGYSDGSYNAGLFIGTSYPYIAGDPDL